MKRFIGFVQKEFYHIFRDRRSMFILFGMPVAQILLFGFAITNEINNVEIGILDKSKDVETRKIIEKISASEYFTIANMVDNDNEIEEVFKKGEVKAFLVFEKGFAENLHALHLGKLQVITDATEPNTANTIVNYLQSIIQLYRQELNASAGQGIEIQVHTRLFYNEE